MCLLGRWADAWEVAYPTLWLASDEASYVTGSVLMVAGQFMKRDNGQRTKART
jgi:NAD(P)-dependent dehydrogenase (short-subunit alcohol dehydrogenase family)